MANITKVYLLNVPLENDYKNTLYFTDASSQQSYFLSRTVKSYTDFSYQRKDNIIRIPEEYDNIYNVNYCMYQNTAYSNKWFYAFIKDLHYVNDGMTEATIETDVIQTWLFDYEVKSSFVEREHVNNDTIGLHTVPESLETGEYVCEAVQNEDTSNPAHLVICATYDCFADEDAGSYVNGVYSGVDYFLIRGVDTTNPQSPSYIDAISYFLSVYETKGKIDSITGMFMAPDSLTGYAVIVWDYMSNAGGLSNFAYKKLSSDNLGRTAKLLNYPMLSKPYSTVNGYTPRNKKLFTYPYKYLMVSNNAGANAVYQYEYFQYTDTTRNLFQFDVYGSLTPGCSIRAFPRKYKGVENNYDEGITCGKYPICSYNADMYINWLTQNGVNNAIRIVGGAVSGAITGTMFGGPMGTVGGAVLGGVGAIANVVGEVSKHATVPPQAEGNLNNGDVNYSLGINMLMFYKMTIRSEYAQIIDKYFDMFGYKVNMVKVPNKAHRSRWWYTKTIDANINGNLPQRDLEKIRECYDQGITFWRNASEIENYSLSNNIV